MKRLAIIGMGPRGLYALENVLNQLSRSTKQIQIVVFEPSDNPGAGNVWHTEQSSSNWINITERALSGLEDRPETNFNNETIPSFPSYHQWCEFSQHNYDADSFPPRKKLGKYLNERFNSIKKVLQKTKQFEIIQCEIDNIDFNNPKLTIHSNDKSWECDDIVLTIGHQSTEVSDQLKSWNSHVKKHKDLIVFNEPYPVSQLSEIKNKKYNTIGIRGFGLAMIDVMRYLVINDFGNFKVIDTSTFESTYNKSKEQHLKIIPFSLDGLPMSPKPINPIIDHWYKPTTEELDYFKNEIDAITQTAKEAHNLNFLTHPIAEITSRVFMDLKARAFSHNYDKSEVNSVILDWFEDDSLKHALLQDTAIPSDQLIRKYIDMALGEIPISLDFCIGQVWRHCQPLFYKTFSHAKLNNETLDDVITLDERIKRYSYGPPIESLQQMLALVDAEILNLDFVADPDIELNADGWTLKNNNDKSVTCSIMINSVLDSPKLLDVNSSIVKNLLKNDLIQPVHSELGIETSEDGYVKTSDIEAKVPIAVLGRLAKGSVVGVDAILECFGPRIEDWAKAYIKKLKD